MNRNEVTIFKVAATYIGTIVGAGFATGQEMLQFFIKFGILGLFGILITIVLFIFFGEVIMMLGKRYNAKSHLEIIQKSGGKTFGKAMDILIIIFLFGGLTAMIAGTGALFEQQFNMPILLGNITMALITAITVLRGIEGVVNSMGYVVPFLLFTVLGTCAISIINNPPELLTMEMFIGGSEFISNWVLAAILFVSYNMVIVVAVLGPLGAKVTDLRTIRKGALLGGLSLGIGSIMIYLTLTSQVKNVYMLEVPMIYIAREISPVILILYTGVLIAAIYTTAVGSLFGFVSRFTNLNKTPASSWSLVFITTIFALLASQFGFSNLVKYLYPMIGFAGIALLLSLLYAVIRDLWSQGTSC
ncbi:YkvI family membrane protein [Desulfuribacillus alkaliarsenatis]|uniref:Membrane protein YkvI n=1 Tax=Desulfuribacillus alkaliarsenatis TaxID=766136 RepID=A0A1E5G271_9FIRM|nr:hypothetical protein [Desulfuribacillus alkaliarsenatis]OEF97088.1 hypothetical protein BHF68_05680 [Desulfuribacillus alkaliarsenatis]